MVLSRMHPRARGALMLWLGLAGLAALLVGCSDSSGPAPVDADQGGVQVGGELDPGAGTFVLQTLDEPPPGDLAPIRVSLIGSNLQVDPDSQTVALDVALRNDGDDPLYRPAHVLLTDFWLPNVSLVNPDFIVVPIGYPEGLSPGGGGFDYSEAIGDGVLEPGETSAPRTWIFHVPGLVGFSFEAQATFGLLPDLPRIAGGVWHDLNANGLHERNEPFYPYPSTIVVTEPDGDERQVGTGELGAFAFPVDEPGLYELRLEAGAPGPAAPVYTTANPLQVLLPPDEHGDPVSYLTAMFGVALPGDGEVPPLVILTEQEPDTMAFWDLLVGRLDGDVLRLKVGFSGCQPEHPFRLFMVGSFQESDPVQARLVLQHDDLGEFCEAYWTADLAFDVGSVRHFYTQHYGEHGVIDLKLRDYWGTADHIFRYIF